MSYQKLKNYTTNSPYGAHKLCDYITNLLSMWLLISYLGPFIFESQMQLI